MIVETENVRWSETGKRVDFSATVYEEGLFSRGDKLFSFKMFALGAKEKLTSFFEDEDRLAKKVAEARKSWLQSAGKRYYNYELKSKDITVRIWKSKYQTYES